MIELEVGGPWYVTWREAVHYYVGHNAVVLHDGEMDFMECENVHRFVDLVPASS
jgi:hypothetical protein